MTSTILIGLMILLYTLQSLLCKKYSDHYPGMEDDASPVFSIVSGIVVFVVSLIMIQFRFEASFLTVLLSVANAAVLLGYNVSLIKAAQTGAYSILMVFSIAGGIIIPSGVAALAFQDKVSLWKMMGIALVLVAVYMVSRKKGESVKHGKAFFPMCLLLGFCNGAYGALLDVQQRLTGSEEREEMVALTYALVAILGFMMLLLRQKGHIKTSFLQNKKSFFYLMICSIVVALAIHSMVYIIPLVNITVLYTMDNAGVFLLSVLSSCLFFKEKLSVLNSFGCGLMCAALVIVAMF